MIDRARGGTSTGSLDLTQASSFPGPAQYPVKKAQPQYDSYTNYQGHYLGHDQQQQQQQVCQNNHTMPQCQPFPQHYHQYNQTHPQQPRLPSVPQQQPQQPMVITQQQQQQQLHQNPQLPFQQLPQQSLPKQPSSTAPGWTHNSTHQHQQPHHNHLQQQQSQHHHNSLHQNNQQSNPQNTSAPTPTTSQHHHQHHCQHQQQQSNPLNTSIPTPSTSQTHHTHNPHETQSHSSSSPAAFHHPHLHPTSQDMAALEEEKARLEAQLKELRDRRRCVVCLDKDQGAIFMPCAHLVTCPSCAVILSNCPVCRTRVQYLLNVILD